jgi:hypothetical protein
MDLIRDAVRVPGSEALVDECSENDFVIGVGYEPCHLLGAALFRRVQQDVGAILPFFGEADGVFREAVIDRWAHGRLLLGITVGFCSGLRSQGSGFRVEGLHKGVHLGFRHPPARAIGVGGDQAPVTAALLNPEP